ncbi:MAG: hypothetical protein JJT95_02820 [Pararhodobacter sp.]|nr:hypothetical protein [Pararhodobacter sp.]
MLRFALFLGLLALALWAVIAGPLAGPVQSALAPVLQPFGRWLLSMQAEFQQDLARELRGAARGQSAAVWALLGLCLVYGFVHAAGPGHGKALIGAYGVARRIGALRLAGIGLAASLAQATVAVVLVLALAGLAGMGRGTLEGIDRQWLEPLGLAALAALGVWLLWRALARMAQASRLAGQKPQTAATQGQGPASAMLAAAQSNAPATPRAHVYGPACPPDCPDCGARHMPPPQAMLQASTPREVAALITAVAVRPCSGALLLLLLTWQMGMIWLGILGAYAMGLGTAGLSVALALALVTGRNGLMRLGGSWLAGPGRLWLAGTLEAGVGLALLIGALAVLVALG